MAKIFAYIKEDKYIASAEWPLIIKPRQGFLATKDLKKYLTYQLHIWWNPSLWPKDEVIRFWEKSPWGKGGPGGGGGGGEGSEFGLNVKSLEKIFRVAIIITPKRWELDM